MKGLGLLLAGVLGLGALAVARSGDRGRPARPQVSSTQPVPRLIDLGAGRCIPCKAMAPILEELRAEYAGRMEVQFIDVWKDPAAAEPYGIRMIPTQIFFGGDGKELARHQGFMSKAEILAQWRSVGVSL